MRTGSLLLIGLMLIWSISLSGCGSVPQKKITSAKKSITTAEPAQPDVEVIEVVEKFTAEPVAPNTVAKPNAVKVVRALPLPRRVQANNQRQTAQQRQQAQLRLQRQREWEENQRLEAKRAEYRRKWEQQQAVEKQRLAALQVQRAQEQQARQRRQQEQRALAAKRQQYHAKWQQAQLRQQQQAQQQQVLAQQVLAQQQQAQRQQAQRRQQQQAQQWQQAQARQRQQAQYQQVARRTTQPTRGYGGRGTGNYYAARLGGNFAGNRQLLGFVENMVARHGFDRGYLYGVFSQTRNRDAVARLWAGNNGGKSSGRGWYNYRSKFVTPGNIQKGVQFWQQYRPHIMRASQRYGVDPEYIVGIMGVETRWGRILGKHRVIDALTTSAIVNKRRSRFFFKELENYLLMTRSERMDPLQPKGSYAGAMGYGQFMPSSFRAFAVDFNGDGIRDLWNPVDAIGSVANYFAKHGWKAGQEVVVPAKVSSMKYARMPDGFKVKYSRSRLAKNGIRPRNGRWSRTGRTHLLALTTVPGGLKEPWIGYHNFYVITRYNHSNYYAMAVHQLAKGIQRKVAGQKYASR